MVNITRITKKRLGELLLGEGVITQEKLDHALELQKQSGKLLGEILIELGHISEFDIAKTLVTQYNLPFLKASCYTTTAEVTRILPPAFLKQHQLLPLDRLGDTLVLAISGLVDKEVLEEVERVTGLKVQIFVTIASEVRAQLGKLAGTAPG